MSKSIESFELVEHKLPSGEIVKGVKRVIYDYFYCIYYIKESHSYSDHSALAQDWYKNGTHTSTGENNLWREYQNLDHKDREALQMLREC